MTRLRSRYFNYCELWEDILDDVEEILIDELTETLVEIEDEKNRKDCIEFLLNKKCQPLDIDECSIDGDKVWLCFGEEGIGANESDNQGSFWNVNILYNFDTERIEDYEYEQG